MHIVMLLSNAFRPDPRVFKEAQSLANEGDLVSIICWDRLSEFPAHEAISNNVKIIRIKKINSSYGIGLRQIIPLLRFWWALPRIINELKPDIIHCHDFDTILPGLICGKIRRTPVIYDAHEYYAELVRPRLPGIIGNLLYNSIRMMDRLVARLSDAVVTVDVKLGNIYGQVNRRIIIVGHYPQLIFVQNKSHSFTHQQLNLLYAGRISQDRGSLVYIDLLQTLINRDIPTKLLFVGVYTPSDEEYLVKKKLSGMESNFEYLGWVPYQDMREIYSTADIGLSLLLPIQRYISALPVKLFEYMASGLPVIASNFPSIVSVLDETKCGFYADPVSSIEEISNTIEVWWKNPAIPRRMGVNGIEAIKTKYNWELQINKLINLYNELTSK